MHPVVVRRDHLVSRLREERDANQVQSSAIKRSQMQSSAIDVREERDGDANRGPLRRPRDVIFEPSPIQSLRACGSAVVGDEGGGIVGDDVDELMGQGRREQRGDRIHAHVHAPRHRALLETAHRAHLMRDAISMHSMAIRGTLLDARCPRAAVGNQVQSSAIKCNQV